MRLEWREQEVAGVQFVEVSEVLDRESGSERQVEKDAGGNLDVASRLKVADRRTFFVADSSLAQIDSWPEVDEVID